MEKTECEVVRMGRNDKEEMGSPKMLVRRQPRGTIRSCSKIPKGAQPLFSRIAAMEVSQLAYVRHELHQTFPHFTFERLTCRTDVVRANMVVVGRRGVQSDDNLQGCKSDIIAGI